MLLPDFLQIFNFMTKKISNSSVSSPTAHTYTLCVPGVDVGVEIKRILELSLKFKFTFPDYYYIIMLQLLGGLRISEVLGIKYHHITSSGAVNVRGLKGSNNKFVVVSELRSWLLYCKDSRVNPFDGISRFMVYRFYKKHSISCLFDNRFHCSVTHYLRHLFAMDVISSADSILEVKDALGQKSLNSTKHYIH